MDKINLRKKYKIIRKNIDNRKEKNELIFDTIINLPAFKNALVVAIYYSFNDEVDTIRLIEYSLKDKTVCLPKISDNGHMEFYKIDNINCIINKNKYGILEPSDEFKIDKNDIDIAVVPGICFDIFKNRIGYGAGYYDNYLRGSNILKIAIAYDEQISSELINNDLFDIKMDMIVTDKKIVK